MSSMRVRTLQPQNTRTFLVNNQLSIRPAFSTNLSSPIRHFSEKAATPAEGEESSAEASSGEKTNAESKDEPQDANEKSDVKSRKMKARWFKF